MSDESLLWRAVWWLDDVAARAFAWAFCLAFAAVVFVWRCLRRGLQLARGGFRAGKSAITEEVEAR